MHRLILESTDILKLINTFLPLFFTTAPEIRTAGCRHLVNRGVRSIGADRNCHWNSAAFRGNGPPHHQPLAENDIILDVFSSPDLQMWVARLLGNYLNGLENTRVTYEELKCKGMLENLAELLNKELFLIT
jgi:hypothetical protein